MYMYKGELQLQRSGLDKTQHLLEHTMCFLYFTAAKATALTLIILANTISAKNDIHAHNCVFAERMQCCTA